MRFNHLYTRVKSGISDRKSNSDSARECVFFIFQILEYKKIN